MARELKLVTWCDGDHEEDVPSVVVRTLTVDGGKPVLLDLCEPCDKVIQDVLALMAVGVLAEKAVVAPTGRRERPSRSSSLPLDMFTDRRLDGRDRTDCPDCDYDGNTRSAMGQHLKTKHGTKLSDYDWAPIET